MRLWVSRCHHARLPEERGWDDADDASSRLLHLDLTVSSKGAEYLGLYR